MRHHSLRKLQQTFEPVRADRVLECPTVLQVTKRFILYCDTVQLDVFGGEKNWA